MTVNFCVIYRWKLVPGKEEQFRQGWEAMTVELRENAGALGSRLHRSDEGTWVAYAQWPSREAWEKAAVETAAADKGMQQMVEAIAQRSDPEFLDPVADLLDLRREPI